MRIKRFTAPDVQRAMRQVRAELGPEAVILSTSRLADGGVEISAALEGTSPSPAPANGAPPDQLASLEARLAELSQRLGRHMMTAEAAAGFGARPEVAPIYHHLMRQEVDPAIIASVLDDLSAPGGGGIMPRLAIRLKKLIDTAQPLKLTRGAPVVWALVGPTGVGKTTTVAKLAAHFGLRQGLRVGLVTVDTYRIAASEQLKTYGRIMEIPTLVAGDGPSFAEALDELGGLDLILVDTVGRSPGDSGNLDELAQVMDRAPSSLRHLVLACPTRDADQQDVVEAFGRFHPASLIFTKLDETSIYGPIMNQVVRYRLPVSFLATGQKVPDDLEPADRERLVRRLLPPRREAGGESGVR